MISKDSGTIKLEKHIDQIISEEDGRVKKKSLYASYACMHTYIWTESNSSTLIEPNTQCPSLSNISKQFNLNFKQHKMFIAVGLNFFKSFASDLSVDFAPSQTNLFVQGQLIAFLAGGAGLW
jgi:hypothetical protein